MHIRGNRDHHLHYEDGSHRSTPSHEDTRRDIFGNPLPGEPRVSGFALDLFDRQITRHLARHREEA